MSKVTPSRLHTALLPLFALLLNACTGKEFFRLDAKSRQKKATQDDTTLCVPHTAEQSDPIAGRLLGGMQQPGSDEKVRVAETQERTEVETTREQDAKQFTHPAAAAQYGFKAKKIDNDGNCLFRAVADQLQHQLGIPFAGGASPYMVLRRIAANHIISNIDLYKPFTAAQTVAAVEKLVADIEQDREWAGDEALAILSRALQVTIVVVRDKAANVTVYKPAAAPNGTLYLYYKNLSHYESLYKDSSVRATASLEEQVKSQAADTEYPYPEKGPDLTAFLKDTASAIEKEWAPRGQNQWRGAADLTKRKEGPTQAELAKIEIKRRKAEIAKLYATLSKNQADTKTLTALLQQLEELLKLESLWGAEKEDAQSYLEKLQALYGVGNTAVTTLLQKAYSQTLIRVVDAAPFEKAGSPESVTQGATTHTRKLIDALGKLAVLYAQLGDKTKELNYYTEAAVHYQVILHACHKDPQHYKEDIKEVYASLAQIRKAMLVTCKAKGTPPDAAALQAEIESDKSALEAFRAYTRKEVDRLDAILHKEGMSLEEEKQAEEAYIKGSREVFSHIAQTIRSFLAQLYQACEKELGPAPCKYAVMGLGSMALQQMTPYSDAEFAILIEDPKDEATAKQYRDYLRRLTHLVHLRVINLGETVIPMSKYGVSLDKFCQMGFNFDLGGKTPLNRAGKDYDLIQPVSKMLHYLKNEDHKIEHIDKLLPFILESSCYVYGDEALYKAYASEQQHFLKEGKTAQGLPVHQARALQRLIEGVVEIDYTQPSQPQKKLQGDLESFSPKLLGDTTAGQLYNVKQEIYRLPDRLLYGLARYYGILPESCWDAVAQLVKKEVIGEGEAAHHLQYAASFATMLRLRTYLHHQGQSEKITMPMGLNKEIDAKEVQAMFSLPAAALTPSGGLFKYYYTVLPLHSKMQEFFQAIDCGEKGRYTPSKEGDFFHAEAFHDTSDKTIGNIYYRLLQPSKALVYWQKALEHDRKRLGGQHLNVAISHSNIGLVYEYQGNYSKAIKHHQIGLRRRIDALGEQHPDVAISYNGIGNVYSDQGHYTEALKHYQIGLRMRKAALGGQHTD